MRGVLETLVPVTLLDGKEAEPVESLAAHAPASELSTVAAVIRMANGVAIELARATPAQVAAIADALHARGGRAS